MIEPERFDVVEVNITSREVRVLFAALSDSETDVVVGMAVRRRGVEHHFYAAVPTGKYQNGDFWETEE